MDNDIIVPCALLICLQENVELNMTLTTATMISWGKQGEQASKMLLAASHFVSRINISHGTRGTKNVFARLQTREEGI